MTMKKKILTTLSVVLILGLAALGILAYLQDEDSDVNVMTLGEVKIAQHEYERVVENGEYKTDENGYVLQDFTQGKPMMPTTESTNNGAGGWDSTTVDMTQVDSYGVAKVFESKNAVDKLVTVENTGKSDAYVRTIVAIEVGSIKQNAVNSLIGVSIHEHWNGYGQGIFTIDGNRYYVWEIVYAGKDGHGVLAAGETSAPSLMQVYLHSKATNEDMEKLDGNDNGTLDILVLSQAVQSAGFEGGYTKNALDTAFGLTILKVAEWFEGIANPTGIPVDNATELAKQLAAGEDVYLIDDIKLTEGVTISEDTTIDLNGFDLDASANESRPFTVEDGATLTINAEGAEVNCGAYGLVNMTEGTVTINGGTFTSEVGNNGSFIRVSGDEEMEINLNNVTYKAGTTDSGVIRTSGSNVTVNVVGGTYEAGMGFLLENGSITGANITATNTANMWPAVYADGDVTVSGCTIKSACHAIAVGGGNTVTVENCDVQAADGKLAFQVFSSGGTINVVNCTYTGGYGTTGRINSGCPDAVIIIDGTEVYRKSAQ